MRGLLLPQDLRRIADFIAGHPEGIGIGGVARAFPSTSRRTLNRRLASLVESGSIWREGIKRGAVYYPPASQYPLRPERLELGSGAAGRVGESGVGSDEWAGIELSAPAREVREYVSRSIRGRAPVGYEYGFLDEYEPNRSAYFPASVRAHLHEIGKPMDGPRVGGTFARDVLSRLLIDLSWASCRLEGNTYSRLDTQRLIDFGQAAAGKDALETQMILNHKAAIEWLVEAGRSVGIDRLTLLNLHALLSDGLMRDPDASGRLRRRPVEISGSVYLPSALPQRLEQQFDLVLHKAAAIHDPFEQAFFLMVQLPYLQPFEDVNKRVSRLAANIPLFQGNLCPLTFVDVSESAYVLGTLGVYEMTRIELLRDVFIWAYEQSCRKYIVARDSIAEPDLFRMKYRAALSEVIGGIVRAGADATNEELERRARHLVEPAHLRKFIVMASDEFVRMYEGNISRYGLLPSEYLAWRERSPSR